MKKCFVRSDGKGGKWSYASEVCLGVLSGQQGTFSAGIVLFRGTDNTILNTTKVKPSCILSPVSLQEHWWLSLRLLPGHEPVTR